MVIRIHPKIVATVSCLRCESTSVDIKDIIFEGIHVLVDCDYKNCSTRFYHPLQIAHDAQTPISFSEDGSIAKFDESAKTWLALPLMNALFSKNYKIEPEIQKKNLNPLRENVILLNCI